MSQVPAKNTRLVLEVIPPLLAAAFNLLMILVICFALMPRVDQSIEESRNTNTVIHDSYRILQENTAELIYQHKILQRMSDLLDAAEAKSKALQEKRKQDKDKDKEKSEKKS